MHRVSMMMVMYIPQSEPVSHHHSDTGRTSFAVRTRGLSVKVNLHVSQLRPAFRPSRHSAWPHHKRTTAATEHQPTTTVDGKAAVKSATTGEEQCTPITRLSVPHSNTRKAQIEELLARADGRGEQSGELG